MDVQGADEGSPGSPGGALRDGVKLVKALIRERRLFAEDDRLFSPPSPKADGLPLHTDEWPEGRPVYRGHFRDLWHVAHDEAGIERNGRSFHKLRGSHLTWLLAGGSGPRHGDGPCRPPGHRDHPGLPRSPGDADTRALTARSHEGALRRLSTEEPPPLGTVGALVCWWVSWPWLRPSAAWWGTRSRGCWRVSTETLGGVELVCCSRGTCGDRR